MKKTYFLMMLGVAGLCLGRAVAQEAESAAAEPAPAETAVTESAAVAETAVAETAAVAESAAVPVAEEAPAVAAPTSEMLQRESIRRQELLLKATKSLDVAQELIAKEKFDDARVKVEDVVKTIPNSGEGAEVYRRANVLLSGLDVVKAKEYLQQKDYFNARASAKAALQENPKNQEAGQLLLQVDKILGVLPGQDAPANPAVDTKFISNLNKVNDYIKSGRDLAATGQYDAARQAFQQALAIDPTNKVASNESIRLEKKIEVALDIARDSSAQERRTATRKAWMEQFYLVDQSGGNLKTGSSPISMKNNFAVAQKLRSIVLGNVNFNEATVEDAMHYLREETRRLDPDGAGINFIIQSDKVKQQSKPFTIRLSNVPVSDLLRYITNLANVRYRVDEYAVFIVPLNASDDVLVSREFPVRATFFEMDNQADTDAPRAARRVITRGGASGGGQSDDIRRSLEARGVVFADGATAIYNASTGILTVRNTQDQIDLIEELVTENQGETLQVAVQARLLDINQEDLASLAFNYNFSANLPNLTPGGFSRGFNGGTNLIGVNGLTRNDGIEEVINLGVGNNAAHPPATNMSTNKFAYSGVIDGHMLSVLVEALNQKKSTDLMAAPSIVVNDGQQGKITVARRFFYPTEFDQAQVQNSGVADLYITGGDNGLAVTDFSRTTVVPAWPTSFEERPIGVVLTVKPAVTTDRKRVFLVIKPEITEFDGFINYGSPIYTTVQEQGGYRTYLLNQNIINQPVFSTRTVENAQLEVQDGYTMVLGGLIREDISTVEDKIPILGDIPLIGRAFRSKAEQAVKRNLLIFVTVRILRPDGQPLNPSTGSMSNPVASGG